MNVNAGFVFAWWRIAAAIHFTFTTQRIGFGGGVVIDPQSDHPSIFANLLCAFFLVTVTMRICAHAKGHA